MNVHVVDGVLESVYEDDDVSRAHAASLPAPPADEVQVYSKAILRMVAKMKKGSIKRNNIRSRKIVKASRVRHEKLFGKDTPPIDTPKQKNIFDFGGN